MVHTNVFSIPFPSTTQNLTSNTNIPHNQDFLQDHFLIKHHNSDAGQLLLAHADKTSMIVWPLLCFSKAPLLLENKEKADQSHLASQSGNKRTQNKRFDQPQHGSKYFSFLVPSVRFTVRSHESVSLARLKQQSAPRSCVDATARGPKHCLAHYSPRKVTALPVSPELAH